MALTLSRLTIPNRILPRFSAPVSFERRKVYSVYYTNVICVFLCLCLALPFTSAQETTQPTLTTSFATDFPQLVSVSETNNFQVKYAANYKVVTVGEETYLLFPRDLPTPFTSPNGYESAKKFAVPVTSVAVEETTTLTFLELLGVRGTVKQVPQVEYISSPCFRQQLNTLGGPNNDNNRDTDPQVELVFASGKKNQSNSISIRPVYEKTPLGRLEWIKLISMFYNKEELANQIFQTIKANYNCVKTKASSASLTTAGRPVVAIATYSPPSRYNNASFWSLSTSPYKKVFVEDAGGVLLSPPTTYFTSIEGFQQILMTADILIDESYITSKDKSTNIDYILAQYGVKLNDQRFKFSLDNGKRIFRQDNIQTAVGTLDWFEGAVPLVDAVLQDFVMMIQSSSSSSSSTPNYKRTWFRLIGEEPTIRGTEACVDPGSPLKNPASVCTIFTSDGGSSFPQLVVVMVAMIISFFF